MNALAEYVLAHASGIHTGRPPVQICAERYGAASLSTRALIASLGSGGGYLVPEGESMKVIEALLPLTTVRKHTPPANVISMPEGNIRFAKETSAPSVQWLGEGAPTAITLPSFGDLAMQAKKITAAVPMSNDLLRYSNPSAEGVVEGTLLAALAAAEDFAFLAGVGSQYRPKGIRWSANTVNASTGSTAAEIIADLQGMIAALEGSNVRMKSPCWFTSTTGREFLSTLVASSGNFQFPSIGHNQTLFGWPVAATTAISGLVMLVDMADFYIGQSVVDISIHNAATYTANGTTVNTFDLDQSAIRLVSLVDCALAHKESAAVLDSVSWA
jgi:HK97 family phage major capsid protein